MVMTMYLLTMVTISEVVDQAMVIPRWHCPTQYLAALAGMRVQPSFLHCRDTRGTASSVSLDATPRSYKQDFLSRGIPRFYALDQKGV